MLVFPAALKSLLCLKYIVVNKIFKKFFSVVVISKKDSVINFCKSKRVRFVLILFFKSTFLNFNFSILAIFGVRKLNESNNYFKIFKFLEFSKSLKMSWYAKFETTFCYSNYWLQSQVIIAVRVQIWYRLLEMIKAEKPGVRVLI